MKKFSDLEKEYLNNGFIIKEIHVPTPATQAENRFHRFIFISNIKSQNPDEHYDIPVDFEDSPEMQNWLENEIENYMIEKKEMFIILMDIVGFSKESNLDQLLILKAFDALVFNAGEKEGILFKYIKDILPTGDGFYILVDFNEKYLHKLGSFFNFLIKNIDDHNKDPKIIRQEIHFRCALNFGEVYVYKWKDHNKTFHTNYIGDGMNDCQRIISFIPPEVDDVIYFSKEIYHKFEMNKSNNIERLGRRKDKHEKEHTIFRLIL